MQILVFGSTGQLARALSRVVSGQVHLHFLSRDIADFTDPEACAAQVSQTFDAVINAAAYTKVDAAEQEPDLAHQINGSTPGAIARACAAHGVPMIQVSSDYVFDGGGDRPWIPGDVTRPLGVYGSSKRFGETEILRSNAHAVILRTSWVFSETGSNFVKTMLRLGAERDQLSIVSDQIGGPTPANALAAACLRIAAALAQGQSGGIYHYAGTPDVSWADFAREIFAAANQSVTVTDITSAQYPTPAQRPLNSRLDCSDLDRDFGIPRPDWAAALSNVLNS